MRRVFQIAVAGTMLLYAFAAAAAPNLYAAGLKAYRAGQYATAYKTLLPLARKNDARAMYLVGMMYESGNGVPQDDPTAVGWFEAASKRDNASAQYSLARMTIEGRGVEKSRSKGLALLSAAANQGHKEATALLERLGANAPATAAATASAAASTLPTPPRQSAPMDRPPQAVFGALNRAAAQGSLDALRAALARAAQTEGSEARKSLPFLARDFARQYWHVESVGDVALARAFTQLAREQAAALTAIGRELATAGDAESFAVAGLLESLLSTGTSASAGCTPTINAARAAFAFAWFQGARCIAKTDARQASDWMRAAAASGHAGAQESVGRSCIEGEPKNWVCAKEWLGRAATAGRASSIPALAWTLANQPQPSENDQRDAVRWYTTAADGGDPVVMNNLAALPERGPASTRDLPRARQWYGRAAELGFGPAQFNLGRVLAGGIGGEPDSGAAVIWLRKADTAGIAGARAALEQLGRQ